MLLEENPPQGNVDQADDSSMKPPFKLVNHRPSADTIETLRDLLGQAEKGQIIGLAFAAMYRRRVYTVAVTDEANRNPTFARGMVAALDDLLSDKSADQ